MPTPRPDLHPVPGAPSPRLAAWVLDVHAWQAACRLASMTWKLWGDDWTGTRAARGRAIEKVLADGAPMRPRTVAQLRHSASAEGAGLLLHHQAMRLENAWTATRTACTADERLRGWTIPGLYAVEPLDQSSTGVRSGTVWAANDRAFLVEEERAWRSHLVADTVAGRLTLPAFLTLQVQYPAPPGVPSWAAISRQALGSMASTLRESAAAQRQFVTETLTMPRPADPAERAALAALARAMTRVVAQQAAGDAGLRRLLQQARRSRDGTERPRGELTRADWALEAWITQRAIDVPGADHIEALIARGPALCAPGEQPSTRQHLMLQMSKALCARKTLGGRLARQVWDRYPDASARGMLLLFGGFQETGPWWKDAVFQDEALHALESLTEDNRELVMAHALAGELARRILPRAVGQWTPGRWIRGAAWVALGDCADDIVALLPSVVHAGGPITGDDLMPLLTHPRGDLRTWAHLQLGAPPTVGAPSRRRPARPRP